MSQRRLLKFKLKDNDVFVKYERESDSAAIPDTATLARVLEWLDALREQIRKEER